MLDHIGLRVKNLEKSQLFYEQLLAPLGFSVVMSFRGIVGFGDCGKPAFWLSALSTEAPASAPLHVAFSATSRAAVDTFYEAGLAAGGVCNGPAGLREQYHANYYTAFLLDPDGNNVEAVCHVGA
ncbi:MAG: VOC family protein [Deltaproteobacteria bacterium]|nr:VOC family protein [Deltaproteobacteria bacterium]